MQESTVQTFRPPVLTQTVKTFKDGFSAGIVSLVTPTKPGHVRLFISMVRGACWKSTTSRRRSGSGAGGGGGGR